MKISPRNKRIVVEKALSEQEKEANTYLSSFMLEAKNKKQLTEAYIVVDTAADCAIQVFPGDMIIVEGNMVEEAKGANFNFLTVKENFVIGVIKE